MKNIFNFDEGTIIVEDILSPQAAPELNYAQFRTQVEAFGGIEVAQELGLPIPPQDASGYAIPTLAKWLDIVFLQLLRLGSRPDVQRIIQYHGQIREALSAVGKGLQDVDISNGGRAVDFPAGSDAAKALFKTPNGNGGYFLFAQHPDKLGSKTLEKISVFTTPRSALDKAPIFGEDTSVWYYMSAEFTDAP
ncbi:uncharacterized protein N7459_008827 [Penicillium hispanicum]|uniref:uncharacterized protein n=1 Tax=Penicillium hispanicum TaxID=1080232 RepID=UPI0025405123|nr:uncharacterized protein N7459_008827 [Penicillium hispanicum]KAJ5574400.1 hypothetical protein N7459_008827 [Penicillium hispanicum]